MPTVQIMWYKGRTTQQKSELADVITKAVAEIGNTTAEDTQVIFHDVEKSNWAHGGVMASES